METIHIAESAAEVGAAGPRMLRVKLRGRILVAGEPEAACTLDTVLGREASFTASLPASEARGPCGRAVAYLEFVGRIEGLAIRTEGDRVVVTMAAPEAKWDRLQQQFAILARMPASDRDELRGHRRIAVEVPDVEISLPNGISVPGRIRDLSRSGAAVEVPVPVAVGERVVLGATRGHVARTLEGGFAVQFARLLPFEQFGSAIRL